MAKKYDLVVKVGEYTDGQGQTKGRFKHVGVMMDGDKGPYILLDRTFNPAGVGGNEGRESILISLYEPKTEGGQQPSPFSQNHPQHQPQQQRAPQPPLDDDVPF
jgi:hypothetical protein